jgi:erythromycin esterase-like protein
MAEKNSSLDQHIKPFAANEETYAKLIDRIGDARFVLIGEASHGTHEFYQVRAELTKALIARAGFVAVAAEADWPDALRANRYVQSIGKHTQSADDALRGFSRFPTWMWRNTVVLEFITWLRQHNEGQSADNRVGFYGMDLYSLHESMREVVEYLDRTDPEAAKRARYRYSCFEDVGEDPQSYGYAASIGLTKSCEDDVVRQLIEMQKRAAEVISRDGHMAEDEMFYAEQNAKIAVNAEEYYRSMFAARVSSWNLRDTHMVETVAALAEHLQRRGRPVKIVLWAHNSHLGDASATDMGRSGEVNVGQLMRERYGAEVVNIGFTTYDGTVTAATNWDEPPQLIRVRPGLAGSYEKLFHDSGAGDFWLDLKGMIDDSALPHDLLERAIGVIYRPQTERVSHYFSCELRKQFDIMIHLEHTRALEPLEIGKQWVSNESEELPETYPFGI